MHHRSVAYVESYRNGDQRHLNGEGLFIHLYTFRMFQFNAFEVCANFKKSSSKGMLVCDI